MKSVKVRNEYFLMIVLITIFNVSCTDKKLVGDSKNQPNILWIFLEDTAPLLGSYGTTLISTPNIDNLAKQGVLYNNVIMPAPSFLNWQ